MKRLAVPLVIVAGISAQANAGVEVGGTAGIHIFSETNALGTKNDDVVSHANSAAFALRLGVYVNAMLGVEAEVGVIPTESRGGNVTFDIYNGFLRGNLIARASSRSVRPTTRSCARRRTALSR
jgi:hypothetical protein